MLKPHVPSLATPADKPWGMRELPITTPDGHTIRLASDGTKVKDESTGIERKTKWDGGKLVSEVNGLGRGKITETYFVDPQSKQLHVKLEIDGPRKSSQMRLYDLDQK